MACRRLDFFEGKPLPHTVVTEMSLPVSMEDYLLLKGEGDYMRHTYVDKVTGKPMIRFSFSDAGTAHRFEVATAP